MEAYYKIVFVYPDSHLEEIEENFSSGREALEYGNSLLAQVNNTEGVFNRHEIEDIFDDRKTIEPYFMIVEFKGKKQRLVYESRGH